MTTGEWVGPYGTTRQEIGGPYPEQGEGKVDARTVLEAMTQADQLRGLIASRDKNGRYDAIINTWASVWANMTASGEHSTELGVGLVKLAGLAIAWADVLKDERRA